MRSRVLLIPNSFPQAVAVRFLHGAAAGHNHEVAQQCARAKPVRMFSLLRRSNALPRGSSRQKVSGVRQHRKHKAQAAKTGLSE